MCASDLDHPHWQTHGHSPMHMPYNNDIYAQQQREPHLDAPNIDYQARDSNHHNRKSYESTDLQTNISFYDSRASQDEPPPYENRFYDQCSATTTQSSNISIPQVPPSAHEPKTRWDDPNHLQSSQNIPTRDSEGHINDFLASTITNRILYGSLNTEDTRGHHAAQNFDILRTASLENLLRWRDEARALKHVDREQTVTNEIHRRFNANKS
ncbi:unnamed protein product [Rotaria sp. Silwood1]|nr:unnamed protein product [Rotaria sp. Silwood1]CAF1564206.1 unnamed protein product [Rotaria sp. Silwood1]CAF3627705.1 unnamed protein product [Rotaria sp. Silwood1]CAF3657945.1 unnamed protein product [Rotaria sp. Silwood1]CAF3662146.1 unnamed protein product [Rotaria sp. Silwood1]